MNLSNNCPNLKMTFTHQQKFERTRHDSWVVINMFPKVSD